MTALNKQALREAAARAGGGKWIYIRTLSLSRAYITEETGATVINCTDGDVPAKCAGFLELANPATVLALLDELEAKDSTIATQQQEIRTLLNALEQATEKRNSDRPGQKRLIGWRASDYTDETSDPELAKNWATAVDVLPIFEGDVNTKLTAAAAGKGEAS
ncbi:ead/Ea22-like family protein [Citrobacter freundii]|uniref:ead/Ea22-like family protein n=1 Tax=Citrobacter freundii TaxID=546 RepID=UPI0019072C93|nr:ead/Ea22-like family protein [Citrobacter freundii]MBJ9248910.1 ead/Ea22-like family protein [Citrobacter freundii]